MEPPSSPTKFPMSPGMPIFAASPDRAASVRSPFGGSNPQSPSLPDLRTSPLRRHRRNDSDVSVHGLAAMFENLEVKDFKEATAKYAQAMQKEKTKHTAEIRQMEKDYALGMGRRQLRIEELEAQLSHMLQNHKTCTPKDVWDACRKEQRDAINKWESAMKRVEEKRGQMQAHIDKLNRSVEAYRAKGHTYKVSFEDARDRKDKLEKLLPSYQGKVSGLERTIKRNESDLKLYMGEAEKYKSQVYSLQVEVEAARAQLGEEVETLKDRLRLVESERDTLKTCLQEEEVLRIAAEGQIPLPAATNEEDDEFASPVRSPRKQAIPEGGEEDKENVAPKKKAVDLKLLQQELSTERRLKERAQDQVEFMKMECQFRCCSCRIADLTGSQYVHDSAYTSEMDRIKASVPNLTPPASSHGDDSEMKMDSSPVQAERLPTPPADAPILGDAVILGHTDDQCHKPPVAFSPTSGIFRPATSSNEVSPREQMTAPQMASAQRMASAQSLSAKLAMEINSSPWTHDVRNTHSILPASRPQSRAALDASNEIISKSSDIQVHEDAIMDSDEEDANPGTPERYPTGPETPANYLMRTITTTTTIPLHFSPATPAMKRGAQPMTPSTIAYGPADAQTPVLGELSLNKVPFDREAALEAIRERRGRARSMAAGHGTPHKQMMEGVKERRDISAPVSRMHR